ncbi:Com family DNA-binding transcriptional regulator [Methylomonas subterranea]|uniref:Com family DNA-binding transcriptional regulator n=1 Tax=Methylomonas subterranea TaxID=2952225 RepID=UPI003531ADD3
METIRCGHCGRKLAEAAFTRLVIKCTRCGTLNDLKAIEPLTRVPRAPDNEDYDGKTDHSLGRRQASSG